MKSGENEDVENHLLRKYHALYLDGIVHKKIEEDDIVDYLSLDRELYSLDYYYNMGKYRLSFVNIEEFKNFKRDKKTIFNLDYLNSFIQVDPEITATFQEFRVFDNLASTVLEQYNKIILNKPIWKFGGLSVLDYKIPFVSKKE